VEITKPWRRLEETRTCLSIPGFCSDPSACADYNRKTPGRNLVLGSHNKMERWGGSLCVFISGTIFSDFFQPEKYDLCWKLTMDQSMRE
jgi:hypothetical protein